MAEKENERLGLGTPHEHSILEIWKEARSDGVITRVRYCQERLCAFVDWDFLDEQARWWAARQGAMLVSIPPRTDEEEQWRKTIQRLKLSIRAATSSGFHWTKTGRR